MINKIILIGRLGQDMTVKTFEGGGKAGNFTLATSDDYKDKNTKEWVNVTDWHNIQVGGFAADKGFKKGQLVYIEGKLKTRKYTDKEGIEKYITYIKASICRLLEKKEAIKQGNDYDPEIGF